MGLEQQWTAGAKNFCFCSDGLCVQPRATATHRCGELVTRRLTDALKACLPPWEALAIPLLGALVYLSLKWA